MSVYKIDLHGTLLDKPKASPVFRDVMLHFADGFHVMTFRDARLMAAELERAADEAETNWARDIYDQAMAEDFWEEEPTGEFDVCR